jgi:hypothetical protein
MKTCATCNASHKNTVERVLRCMGCIAKPSGNTNWRPMGHNNQSKGPGGSIACVRVERRFSRQTVNRSDYV